jgi:prepilin-type N-terminal cleavage/methylation domain-containing protein
MRKRQGFTLVELLVVMALVLLIMVILSEAFGYSLVSLRKAKGIGDLQEKLRTVQTLLRRDLQADHFDGRKRVSELGTTGAQPPREGYFTILGPAAVPTVGQAGYEGADSDTVASYQMTNKIAFTVKLRSNQRDRFFSATVPNASPLLGLQTTFFGLPSDARMQDSTAGSYTSQWAEVCYYTLSNGTRTGNASLNALYRSQKLVVADNSAINQAPNQVPVAQAGQYGEFSTGPAVGGNLYFNNPMDLYSASGNRFTANALAAPVGTLLLHDVISFAIVGFQRGNTGAGMTSYSLTNVSNGTYLDGVFITIRVWDVKTLQARQVTIFQDL